MKTYRTVSTVKEVNLNRLVAKAVLLDMITFVKFGNHLAPNWQSGKQQVCIALGLSLKANPKTVIKALGEAYKQNGESEDYQQTLTKFGITDAMLKM